jgi:hypothetical protein
MHKQNNNNNNNSHQKRRRKQRTLTHTKSQRNRNFNWRAQPTLSEIISAFHPDAKKETLMRTNPISRTHKQATPRTERNEEMMEEKD